MGSWRCNAVLSTLPIVNFSKRISSARLYPGTSRLQSVFTCDLCMRLSSRNHNRWSIKSGGIATAFTRAAGARTRWNSKMSIVSWSPADDALLLTLKDNQRLGWKAIALHFDSRTPNACQFRWRRLKSGTLKTKQHALQHSKHRLTIASLLHASHALSISTPREPFPQPQLQQPQQLQQAQHQVKHQHFNHQISANDLPMGPIVLPPICLPGQQKQQQQQHIPLPPVRSLLS